MPSARHHPTMLSHLTPNSSETFGIFGLFGEYVGTCFSEVRTVSPSHLSRAITAGSARFFGYSAYFG